MESLEADTMPEVQYPLLEYLEKGISASQAEDLLAQHDCLSFPQLRSGLFPAANFDNLEKDETGMANAWLRDSACIGTILLKAGQKEVAARAARGIIDRLNAVKSSFEETILAGQAPADNGKRPPVRYAGQDSQPRYDWANAQNDAIGYGLQFIGAASQSGALELNEHDIATVGTLVDYLDAVKYWHDEESGHWEEIKKINASSIGTALGGLRAVRELATDKQKVDKLIANGLESLQALLPNESLTAGLERKADSALIFLVEPQQVVTGGSAEQIVHNTELNLMGERGFRRYNGDSYWGPDYREHFLVGDRAADFSDPKDMALRDQYAFPGGEAQWTFLDPLLSAYYSKRYGQTGQPQDAQSAEVFLSRALGNIIDHTNSETGKQVWRLPELFFLEKGQWVPNDHLGLLWGQANLLYGLRVYQEVFGDQPIQKLGTG